MTNSVFQEQGSKGCETGGLQILFCQFFSVLSWDFKNYWFFINMWGDFTFS
jgi:hypothetical protein